MTTSKHFRRQGRYLLLFVGMALPNIVGRLNAEQPAASRPTKDAAARVSISVP